MSRFSLIKMLVRSVFGLLLWTAPPVWAAAVCNPNIQATTPTGDFTLDDSNGTATDRKTGLMWMRCSLGQNWDSVGQTCTGNPTAYTWGAALRIAQGYGFAGHSDWRLPNIKELATLVEEHCHSPSLNEIIFPGVSSSYWGDCWSSSTVATSLGDEPTQAWYVPFYQGDVDDNYKTSTLHVRLVRDGKSFGNYVSGGGITETPEQPIYIDPLPPVALTGYRKYLVLLIHGWNSNPDVWAKSMKTNIVSHLKENGYTETGDACEKPLEKDGVSWQICWYDWKDQAGGLPQTAYVKAETEGKALAKRIASEPRSYDFIHFIAHSAGSRVADTATRELPKRNTSPVIHTTFLDAYDPFGSDSIYGLGSDWAEQYVDIRRVGYYILNNTDITLDLAYNFDITELDPNGNNILGSEAHAWPWKWYNQTIVNPDNSYYGFGLSLESGRDQFLSANDFVLERYREFPILRRKCVFTSLSDTSCSESGPLPETSRVRIVVENVIDISSGVIIVGTVQFLSDTLKLITNSPAWVSLPIEITEPIDVLSFDYTYLRQAEGLLSVFFDDQLVFRSDQRVELAGQNDSGNVPIGAITSGIHKLAFRLDAYNNTQSEIDISRIQLGKMEVNTQVFNLLTVAKAGNGSGIVTSDPTGINCGATCTANFSSGTNVALTASPSADSSFAGWSPASCGSPFALVADATCTATFNLTNRPPVVDAGLNLSIISEQQSGTVIQGTATDPDNDSLTYRWLEGQAELLSNTPVGANGEAYLNLSNLPISLAVGTHTLTLEVRDGKETTTDDMLLTINNSAPHAAPTGGGTYQISTPITVGGQVSDFDNDPLTYSWYEGATQYCTDSVQAPANSLPGTPITLFDCALPSLGLGVHTLTLTVSDETNTPVSGDITVEVIDSTAPTLSPAPDKSILWPPNHKMVDISINANASDDSGSVMLSAAVISNEPQNGLGDGDTTPDWTNPVITNGVITLQLRAERSGSGDGRVYTIVITATDESGNSSTADVEIIVPHDKGK